jgi:hypothetical protein
MYLVLDNLGQCFSFFHLYSHVKMFQYKIDFPVATTPNSQANFKLNQLNHEKPKIISRARHAVLVATAIPAAAAESPRSS